MTHTLIYNPTIDQPMQNSVWACLANSIAWAVRSIGSNRPSDDIALAIRQYNIVTKRGYLVDKTGHDIADWTTEQFRDLGITAQYTPSVTFDDAMREAGRYPIVLGGSIWLHYCALRGYDSSRGELLLANSSPGWKQIHQTMSRSQFNRLRPISMIRVAPPQVVEERQRYVGRVGISGLHEAVIVGGTTLFLPKRPVDREHTWRSEYEAEWVAPESRP